MDTGWVIMSTWIVRDESMVHLEDLVTGVSFRLGKGTTRVILTTDITIAVRYSDELQAFWESLGGPSYRPLYTVDWGWVAIVDGVPNSALSILLIMY